MKRGKRSRADLACPFLSHERVQLATRENGEGACLANGGTSDFNRILT